MIQRSRIVLLLALLLPGMASSGALAAGAGPTLQQLQEDPRRYAGTAVDLHICVDNGMHGIYVRDCASAPVTTSRIGLYPDQTSAQVKETFMTLFAPVSGPSYEMRVVGNFKINDRVPGDHWGTATSIVATSILDARAVKP